MIDTIVFDLDGTLLNTLEDLKDSVNYALSRQNFPQRSLTEIRSFVGNGIRLLMERSVPENIDSEIFEICFKDFCDYYKIHMEDKTAPYDGINEIGLGMRYKVALHGISGTTAQYMARSDGYMRICPLRILNQIIFSCHRLTLYRIDDTVFPCDDFLLEAVVLTPAFRG